VYILWDKKMTKTITTEISDAMYKALESAALDPAEWAKSAIELRCREAYNEIYRTTVDRYLEEGIAIPSSKDEIVMDAFTRGWAKTVAQSNAESDAELEQK